MAPLLLSASVLNVGQQLGSYQIVRHLGTGGMGHVFEAVHMAIGRRAAIKVLHARFANDTQIANRFLNEARAASTIEHRNVVDVFEFGRLPDGTTYLVMELLQGESLSSMLARQGTLRLSESLRLVRQVASALVAAHAKGIIHRDLKPENLMIIADPEVPGGTRVKVVDFGIAKLAEPEILRDGGPQLTQTGAMLGTPAYMAPEQCHSAGCVDARADVYALGVILYRCLAGRLPFEAASAAEAIAMHLLAPPPPLERSAPMLPADLVALVQVMLAKRPAERPAMEQVVAQLERLEAECVGRSNGANPPLRGPQGTLVQDGSGGLSSTLQRAAGQRATGRTEVARAGIYGVLAAVALVAAGGLSLRKRASDSGPSASFQWVDVPARPPTAAAGPSAPDGPMLVRWSITSEPTGAHVVRQGDGAVLGVTPWQESRTHAPGVTALLLRRDGHESRELVLANDRSLALHEVLQPLRTSREDPPRRMVPRKKKTVQGPEERHAKPSIQLLPD